jgi:hypothetical protein
MRLQTLFAPLRRLELCRLDAGWVQRRDKSGMSSPISCRREYRHRGPADFPAGIVAAAAREGGHGALYRHLT